MRLLIDTHVLIWFCQGSPRLSRSAKAALIDPGNHIHLSAASYWEICLKIAKGKLELMPNWQEEVRLCMLGQDIEWLDISPSHCEATVELVTSHGDPFDRMILAQAKVEQLTLVTIDPLMHGCGVPVLW